jgi:hypothetical protein
MECCVCWADISTDGYFLDGRRFCRRHVVVVDGIIVGGQLPGVQQELPL